MPRDKMPSDKMPRRQNATSGDELLGLPNIIITHFTYQYSFSDGGNIININNMKKKNGSNF